jgi:hypothetical protein
VFSRATVKVNKMIYLSQCTPVAGRAAAVTDHMGIGVEVSK